MARQTRRDALAAARAGGVALVRVPWNAPLRSDPKRHVRSVLKAVSSDREALVKWCLAQGIPAAWIHRSRRGWWHVDLWGAGERLARREPGSRRPDFDSNRKRGC